MKKRVALTKRAEVYIERSFRRLVGNYGPLQSQILSDELVVDELGTMRVETELTEASPEDKIVPLHISEAIDPDVTS